MKIKSLDIKLSPSTTIKDYYLLDLNLTTDSFVSAELHELIELNAFSSTFEQLIARIKKEIEFCISEYEREGEL